MASISEARAGGGGKRGSRKGAFFWLDSEGSLTPGSELGLCPAEDEEVGDFERVAAGSNVHLLQRWVQGWRSGLGGDTGPQPHHLRSNLHAVPMREEGKTEMTRTSLGGWEMGQKDCIHQDLQ